MKRITIFLMALLIQTACAQHRSEVLELLKSDEWDRALIRLSAGKDLFVPEVITFLKHEEPQVRARAAHLLRFIDSVDQDARASVDRGLGSHRPKAVEALLGSAKDEHANVKTQSVWALAYLLRNRKYGHHGEPWSDANEVLPIVNLGTLTTKPLVELLNHVDENDNALYGAKVAAVRVLAATKDRDAADGLLSFLRVGTGFLLAEAMEALIALDNPRTVRAIIDVMDREILSYEGTPGIWALRKIKERALPDVLWATANHPKSAIRARACHYFYFAPDARAVAPLQKATLDKSEWVRFYAAAALGKNRHPTNTQALVPLLADQDVNVRAVALQSLGISGQSDVFDVVAKLLRDKNLHVRCAAVSALAELDPKRSVKVLLPHLKDPELQLTVIRALSPLEPKEAEASLIQIVLKGKSYARNEAAEVLGLLKSGAAVPALITMIQDRDWYPRSAAVRALGVIGAPAADGLLKLLPRASRDILSDVLVALGSTRDPRAFQAILPFVKDKKVFVHAIEALGKSGDRRAITVIMPFLESTDGDVLYNAVAAAGDLRSAEAVPLLLKAVDFKGDYVASKAIRALGQIGDMRAFDPLFKIAQDPGSDERLTAIETLGSFNDDRALQPLIKLLTDVWPLCGAAAKGLGKLGNPAALPALERAAASDNDGLAEEAKAAIQAIRTKSPPKGPWPNLQFPTLRRFASLSLD